MKGVIVRKLKKFLNWAIIPMAVVALVIQLFSPETPKGMAQQVILLWFAVVFTAAMVALRFVVFLFEKTFSLDWLKNSQRMTVQDIERVLQGD